MNTPSHAAKLETLLAERILVLDGAMGTMIQRERLSEEQFRGERFREWKTDLRGNNDLLVLTQPALIHRLHCEYLAAGADIIETNTFNSTSVSLADYGMESLAYELNVEAAKLARSAVVAACGCPRHRDDPCRRRTGRLGGWLAESRLGLGLCRGGTTWWRRRAPG